MRRAQGLGLTGWCRIAAVVALLAIAFSSLELRPPTSARAVEAGICVGDEELFFAPAEPVAGEQMLIAVTSSVQHRGVMLALLR